MKRNSLIRFLLLLYVGSTLASLGWYLSELHASQPLQPSQVLGASSETNPPATEHSTSEQGQLSEYPQLAAKTIPSFQAKQYILYHAESGKVVLRSDSLDPVPIASTTKTMTAYLVTKYGNKEEVVTVPPNLANTEGSSMGLRAGEKISVSNLLYGLLLVSGNDAAYTLGSYIGGLLLNNPTADIDNRIARFVEEMNSTAQQLHLEGTKYQDPAGLNDSGHSTAFDLAKLSSLIMQDSFLRNIMTTASTTVWDTSHSYPHELRNSNRFVTDYQYSGVVVGKTGFTNEAGHCLVVGVKRNNATLVAVILHTFDNTNDASAIEARKLLDFGFQNIKWE